MNETTKKGFAIMDDAKQSLFIGKVEEGLTKMTLSFQQLRQNSNTEEWQKFAEKDSLKHSFVKITHQDPFTKHAFDKPRNYSGDADLIDYMYGYHQIPEGTTEIGKQIYQTVFAYPAAQSVRERREIIALMIDELAIDFDNLRILSIACGHLREASISEAVKAGKVSEYLALDQDPLSLNVVQNELSKFNVKPIQSSIKSLFTNGHEFEQLDFVYAAGLYDYLPQPVAIKLTSKMFGMLKSGGKLLVANFAPCLQDIGYMETFMQWKLIYRDEDEVLDFARRIPKDQIAEQKLFWDKAGNVIYLEIVKK